ncbi:MAG: nitroreductase family protein [Candidatus Aminicenantes bacterium]|nr:MAG: nitroreductase family protein [Candidatus Aminicenantes bacterium]
MAKKEETISKEESLHHIKLALRRAALIYHYFAKTLVDEFGEKRGTELIRKAVDAYGAHIGQESKQKAKERGLELTPDNFVSDLPDMAWKTETVKVDGEARVRIHLCPLAEEWLDWSEPKMARHYCFVDQAKIQAFNPDYEYVHTKNVLDGDPYCEVAVRQVEKDKTDKSKDLSKQDSEEIVDWVYGKYTREDLMKMDPVCLRALFRERIHHTIEVDIYPVLLGKKKIRGKLGLQPQLILDAWKNRGLPDDDTDFEWGKRYLELAERLRDGEEITIEEPTPVAFKEHELETVRKLIWERCSIRDWIPGKEIPDEMIEKILDAGRVAPTGCNLEIVRFIVIRDPEEAKMVWSDIPTPMDQCVLIVVCYDKRIYETAGHDRLAAHNQLFDCAAAADHICLMAHALGLGAVWLTSTEKTAQSFKKKYCLPDHIEPALHIAVGWPAIGTIKSARMPLSEMVIKRQKEKRGQKRG